LLDILAVSSQTVRFIDGQEIYRSIKKLKLGYYICAFIRKIVTIQNRLQKIYAI